MRCSTVFSLALLAASPALAATLSFERAGKKVAELSTEQISAKVPAQTAAFYDPHAGKSKRYRCWPLKAVLDLAYGPGWQTGEFPKATLTALDGYASISDTAKLAEPGGCLAFDDADVPGFEPMGRKGSNPGPYYLVWTKPEQSTENAYPWPWQLSTIALERFEDRYPQVVPRGAAAGSPAARGFKIFADRCMRCHAVNQQGGRIGPDLNAPRSVTSYRTKAWFKSYVRAPSKYRYTEMPDHPDLSDADLEALWAYFKLKSAQPGKGAGF